MVGYNELFEYVQKLNVEQLRSQLMQSMAILSDDYDTDDIDDLVAYIKDDSSDAIERVKEVDEERAREEAESDPDA